MSSEPTIGPFRLFESRAETTAGHEYAAMDIDTGSRLLLTVVEALTALDGSGGLTAPEIQRGYQQVMGRLSEMDHPLLGMPRRVSAANSEDYWYVSMPTEGTPLRRHLRHHGPLAWHTVALVLHEACATLAFAHKRGIAHGNIDAATVLLEPTGAVRFVRPAVVGRVVFRGNEHSTVSLSALWDDPTCLSPSVLNRHEPIPADDVYALGVLAYELLTGRLPYTDASEPLRRVQSRRAAPDPVEFAPDIPAAMRRLVRAMMAPRATVRIPTASALRAEIAEQFLKALGPNDGRAALAKAMRSHVAQEQVSDPPVPRPLLDDVSAESTIDKALLAAGMASKARPAPKAPPRRGLWAAVGGALVLVVALLALAPSGSPPQDSVAPASEEPVDPAVSLSSDKGVVPAGVTVVQAEPPPVDPVLVAKLKGQALIRSSQYALAERVLRAALEQGDDSDGALRMLLGKALEEQGRLKEAVKVYVRADGQAGERVAGHLRAGVLVAVDGRCPEALPLFLKAASRTEPTAEILKHVGNCQLIVGDNKGAVATLQQAYATDATDLDILVPLAQALENQGDLRGAMEIYRQALGVKPTDSRARAGLTRIAGAQAGDARDLRIDALQMSETKAPVDSQALEVAAHAAFRAGKYATASRLYGEAVASLGDQASASLLRNHAVSLHRAGQGMPAVRAYEAALAASPGDAELNYMLGTLLADERRDSRARRALRAALDAEPGRYKARFQLGLVELRLGNHRAAAEAFEAVVRQRPDDKAALQNLLKARTESGDQAGALEVATRMHAANPKDARSLLTMAALLQSMDRDDEATALLNDACATGLQEACQ